MKIDFESLRERMLSLIEGRGVRDPRVLEAFRRVPRELFVDPQSAALAYEDRPLSIGFGQTISQPYLVAFMAEALRLRGSEKVLEIGTGSGYQTAILSCLSQRVCTIEIEPELSKRARGTLGSLGIGNVSFRVGDGARGWPEEAPFDRVVAAAAFETAPRELLEELGAGGWFLGPLGVRGRQELVRIVRTEDGFDRIALMPVLFVPARTR